MHSLALPLNMLIVVAGFGCRLEVQNIISRDISVEGLKVTSALTELIGY